MITIVDMYLVQMCCEMKYPLSNLHPHIEIGRSKIMTNSRHNTDIGNLAKSCLFEYYTSKNL